MAIDLEDGKILTPARFWRDFYAIQKFRMFASKFTEGLTCQILKKKNIIVHLRDNVNLLVV